MRKKKERENIAGNGEALGRVGPCKLLLSLKESGDDGRISGAAQRAV